MRFCAEYLIAFDIYFAFAYGYLRIRLEIKLLRFTAGRK